MPASSVGIVDFGAKLGSGFHRGEYIENGFSPHVDRDGNGTLTNDFVSCFPYSDTEAFNPEGLDYDTNSPNGVFYGGMTLYTVSDVGRRNLSEGHINQNHEFKDDFNLMTLPAPRSNELLEAYGVFYWKKSDFINGGDQYTVTFDSNSAVSVHITRYWGGVNAGRWLVKDGDQFYLSQDTFGGVTQQFYVGSPSGYEGGVNPITRKSHEINPLDTQWAPYTPVPDPNYPYDIDFDHTSASFSSHTFTNVTAVGFFIERSLSPPYPAASALTLDEPIGVKWGAMRAEAVVNRPAGVPSCNLDLAPVGVSTQYYAASNAVSYSLWRRVFRFAVRRQRVENMGLGTYSLERDGSAGGMRADGLSHNGLEPVTDITWYDAAAWCNALSEYEGLEPAYYTEPAMTNVLRRILNRDMVAEWTNRPSVYWSTNASGYRLPTHAEWAGLPAALRSTDRWEYIWFPTGAVMDASTTASRTVLGWGLTAPTSSVLTFAQQPWSLGGPQMTFRPVRTASGAPVLGTGTGVTAWTFSPDTVLPATDPMSLAEMRSTVSQWLAETPLMAGLAGTNEIPDEGFNPYAALPTAGVYEVHVSNTEIPYHLWDFVCQWAEAEGYRFNYAGSMGSLANDPGAAVHHPGEPVTQISLYDTYVWCNALSEMMGLKPVYYRDAAFSNVWREANLFRLETFLGEGYPHWPGGPLTPIDTASYIPTFQDVNATGYRVPLPQEWKQVNVTDANSGTDPYNWFLGNAGGKTQPVGTKLPNPVGLYDMEGNVRELTWGDARQPINRQAHRPGSHFARGYQESHPTLDISEFPAVGRAHVGFRVLRRSPQINIGVSTNRLPVGEGGSATFGVWLTAPPASATTVHVGRISGDADLSVSAGQTLSFITNAWGATQMVTLAAADDADTLDGQATIRCSSAGLDPQDILAVEVDDELGLRLTTNALTIGEGSQSNFSVRLNRAPAATVTVQVARVSGDNSVTVSAGGNLVFTPLNGLMPQPVTVDVLQDADEVDGAAVIRCSLAGADDADIQITTVDDDHVVVASGLLAAWELNGVDDSPVVISTNARTLAAGLTYSAAGGVLTHSVTDRMVGRRNALAAIFTASEPSLADAIDAGHYFTWSLDLEAGYKMTITGLTMITEHDGTVMTGVVMSSVSGFSAGDEIGSMPAGLQTTHIPLGGQADYENIEGGVEFRLYAFGDTDYKSVYIGDSYNTGVREDDVAIYGTIVQTGTAGPQTDSDGDGMPDWYEDLYGPDSTSLVASADGDADLYDNLSEFIAGSDPLDPGSRLQLSVEAVREVPAIPVRLAWNSASGRVYAIHWGTNLAAATAFSVQASNLSATPPKNVYTDTTHNAAQEGYYRIDVRLEE